MIPNGVKEKIGRNLYKVPDNPIGIVWNLVKEGFTGISKTPDAVVWDKKENRDEFEWLERDSPAVSVADNFDSLLVPKDHPSRSRSDTYYLNDENVLRTHMTAHLVPLVSNGHYRYVVCGDVYRKDEIDSKHYPVFHQIDGFRFTGVGEDTRTHLRKTMTEIVTSLLPGFEYRIIDERDDPTRCFPFTQDSLEVEVRYGDAWYELLGAGTVRPEIMTACGLAGKEAWAFGMGVERVAMLLFGIPDIRLFWSKDPRFTEQFRSGQVTKFVPFSTYNEDYRDISFWIGNGFKENDFSCIVREEADDLVREIQLLDKFTKDGQTSHCYRIFYQSFSRYTTFQEINGIQDSIRDKVVRKLGVSLR